MSTHEDPNQTFDAAGYIADLAAAGVKAFNYKGNLFLYCGPWWWLLRERREPRTSGHPEWRPPWGPAVSVTVGARDRFKTRLNSTLTFGGRSVA